MLDGLQMGSAGMMGKEEGGDEDGVRVVEVVEPEVRVVLEAIGL